MAAGRIVELWRELWCTAPAVHTHQTHEDHHSHRLGPSTWSHSLGLRGRGERGQSWQVWCVCVCAVVRWGQCAKVYISSLWTCLSGKLPSESSWLYGKTEMESLVVDSPWFTCAIIKSVALKEANVSLWPYAHVHLYCWPMDGVPLPTVFMFTCLFSVFLFMIIQHITAGSVLPVWNEQ